MWKFFSLTTVWWWPCSQIIERFVSNWPDYRLHNGILVRLGFSHGRRQKVREGKNCLRTATPFPRVNWSMMVLPSKKLFWGPRVWSYILLPFRQPPPAYLATFKWCSKAGKHLLLLLVNDRCTEIAPFLSFICICCRLLCGCGISRLVSVMSQVSNSRRGQSFNYLPVRHWADWEKTGMFPHQICLNISYHACT